MARNREALLVCLFLSFSLFAEDVPTPSEAPSVPSIQEVFSIEATPATGSLHLKVNNKDENIVFGTAEGRYAIGMFFRGSKLPPPYNREFKDLLVLQLAFGNSKATHPKLIPQFAAITLASKGNLGARRVFHMSTPDDRDRSLKDKGIMLFASADFPLEQTDEEKLKGSFFAKNGDIVLASRNDPVKVEFPIRGKNLTFSKQMVAFEVISDLVTPFSPTEAKLSGKIEFPVYWPVSPAAEKLVMEIASESLTPLGASHAQPENKRDVAGKK